MKKFLMLTAVAMLFVGVAIDAFAGDVEKALSHDLSECGRIVRRLADGSKSGASTADDIARLKKSAEAIQADRLLLAERHGALAERAATLGGKATDRQDAVSSLLLKHLDDLLSRLDAIDASVTPAELDSLKQILDILVPHKSRPLLGALPYRHTNYPPREPATSPVVKPAYKGGDRSVYAADTATTPEAPISKEIVEMAQSLQWNPVLIYEWVKNNVETEWYWGSMKGAEETLRQKSGNDADQAALLVALLRASGFPSRYIKGTIEFFPDIEKAKNLTGLDDPMKIAAFFQKAGIPFKPVIAGGKIVNFQVEHIWVESFIPYSNYRGAVVDEQGKIWLGLDTSIKPPGYTRTNGTGLPDDLIGSLRDDYLASVQQLTLLEYIKLKADEYQAANQPGKEWNDLLDKQAIIPDVLKIIPSGLQFPQIAITGEYQTLPDELKHKLTFTATSNGNDLFSITLETHKLSNKTIALRAEPETVEDQNLIDSFGGLDNTPAYLVRLRPVLTIDGERIIVAQDGLPMGGDYTLNIDVTTPNGAERITSSHVAGNLSVIAVVGQKAQMPAAITEDDDAEAILHKESNSYIDRWNRAEDELAALLGQRISRPAVSIVTVGGQIEVSTLLDMPHDFTWKGLFLDAGYRRVETTGRNSLEKEFMRLSSLQGSILENRIFEDDLKVDSVSTAKLLQLAAANGTQVLIIDKTNVDAVLPQLTFDDAVKQDIANAVNQGLTVTIPQNEVAYQDWSGIGYIKENPETGESGWMLSGQVAGGMTAVTPLQWVQQNFLAILHVPYTGNFNRDPLAAKRMFVIGATDYQYGTVDTKLRQPLAVLVVDAQNRLVSGARVTFKTVAGGGGFDPALSMTSTTVHTDRTGIARTPFYLGKKTGDNPIYSKLNPIDPEVTQMGLNLVTASVEIYNGDKIDLADSFSSFAKPDTPVRIIKVFGDNTSNVANNPAGSLQAKVVDQFDNPVSNVVVQFEAVRMELAKNIPLVGAPAPLPTDARMVKFYTPETCTLSYPIHGECPSSETLPRVSGYAGCFVNTILGDTVNTKYTVDVTTPGIPAIDKVSFTVFSEGYRTVGEYLPHSLLLRYLELYTPEGFPVNATKVGTRLSTPLTAELLVYMDDYTMQSTGTCARIIGDPYPCWRIVPSGKTKVQKVPKDKGTVVFKASGGGSTSATRDLGNGKYEADFTAEPVPERNRITTTGKAKIRVPEVLYDTETRKVVLTGYAADSMPMRDIELPINKDILFNKAFNSSLEHDPITRDTEKLLYYTVFAVDALLNIQPASIAITKDGRAKRDTAFTYTILPADYNSIISDIDFFTRDPITGIDEWAFQLHGDKTQGQGTSIILAGSQWDVRKKYLARATLNNGSAIEIDGDKKPIDILLGAMVPDYNHDRKIDPEDRDRAELGDKHYFWVNDDDGNGDTEGSGIPGSGSVIDPAHLKVNGTRDLVDFFPVHLDIKHLFEIYDPATYKYRLRNADSALNYVVTDLGPTESGEYLTGKNRGIGYVRTMGEAPTLPITDTSFNIITASYLALNPAVIENIKHDKGVILIEGYKRTTNPLVLEVYNGTTLTYSQRLNLSIEGVEQMFRHKNLIQVAKDGAGPLPAHNSKSGGEPDRFILPSEQPTNFPDSECNIDTNLIALHGYNVDGQEARGFQAEMFKRLYWSGSKARFWAVSWYGAETKKYLANLFTPDYHTNVVNAFDTAPALKDFLNFNVKGDVTIMAHSLGNMVASSMLSDSYKSWDDNYLASHPTPRIKNYFMVDAAVAIEAYDGGATKSLDMIHKDWVNYKQSLWPSEWHQLFVNDDPPDNRAKLTWRGRFKDRPANTMYYNFYSSGEEVLATLPFNTPFTQVLVDEAQQLGSYAWAVQEKLKGGNPIPIDIIGYSSGGWGFNGDDKEYYLTKLDVYGYELPVPIPASDANLIDESVLKTRPFFKKGPHPDLYWPGITGSTYAANNMNRLLANAIPALTLPAGGNFTAVFGPANKNNFDMQVVFKNDNKDWPKNRPVIQNWRHSDLKDVSFPFVYKLFDAFVSLGGLK